MSTIKANKLEHISTANGGIQLDNAGHVTVDGQQMPTTGPLTNRNLLVNGSMIVAQRATQVTGVTGAGYRTCDRWRISMSSLGTWTIDQSTDAPDRFSNSLKVTCTTADASPGTSDNIMVQQRLEGHDLQSLGFGTSSAKAFTISFYVKSNKTGNATFTALNTAAGNKMVSFQYTISSANTWEYKTITVPADTAAGFGNDINRNMQLEWWLNSGSQYTGGGSHQTTWAALSQTKRNASNLGLGGDVNDYWQITGVQLEVGEKATPFEHRSYADELQKCMRYCQRYGEGTRIALGIWDNVSGGDRLLAHHYLPVWMRATPAVTQVTNGHAVVEGVAWYDVTAVTLQSESSRKVVVYMATTSTTGVVTSSGDTPGAWGNGAKVTLDAEL